MFDINNLEMIISITMAYFAGSVILTILFYNLYILHKQQFLLKWVFAWLLLSFAYIALIFSLYSSKDAFYGIYSLFLISYAFMFLSASASFLNFSFSKYLKYILFILYFIIILLTIYIEFVAWSVMIAFITIAFSFFITGIKFTKENNFFNKLTGFLMIIFSITSFFYPFLAIQRWFMPWGYIVIGMLGFFIGMSIIQIHFQVQKEELTLMKNELHYMAHHDSLTDVYNRLFMDKEFLKIEKENLLNIGLLFIDLNNFKQINDTFGHRKGDEILIHVTDIFKSIIKDRGLVIRFGGDEFIIIFYNSTLEEIDFYQKKLLEYSQNHTIDNIKVNFAVGSSFRSQTDHTMYHLVDLAEKEMYKNKGNQKNTEE